MKTRLNSVSSLGDEPASYKLAGLESVDITSEFRQRPSRPTDYEAESRAMATLADEMATNPRNLLQKLVEIALELCRAHSAGVSILEEDNGQKILRWRAVAGRWSCHLGGVMPRDASPCGTVLDRDQPFVLLHPEQFYPIPPQVTPAIVEVLLIPFHVAGLPVGTIWVVAHDESRQFDLEDERLMTNLGKFASSAYQFLGALDAGKRRLAEQQDAAATLRENERRFREMIDALPAAIYTTDAEGRLTHYNPAAFELSGHVPELGTDKWCVSWKLYHPDGTPLPHDQCPMAIALKEGRIVDGVEAILERPDGKRIWFTPYPTPLRDAEGRIVGGINLLLDITERKLSEQTGAKLAAIVESSDDAIIGEDLAGVITSWNAGAARIFRYTAEEAVGKPVTMLIPQNRFDEVPVILERINRGESVKHHETKGRRKDGTLLDVSLTISPIFDRQNQIVGTSKIARDITDRKQLEAERERLLAQQTRDREFLSRLIESSPAAIAVLQGMELKYTLVNPAYQAMAGTDLPIIGRTFGDVFPEAIRVGAHERLREAIRTRHSYRVQDIKLIKNGVQTWWDGEVIPISIESGDLDSVLVLGWPITERKQGEAALRESEERFRTLFASAPVAVMMCDRDAVIQHYNQRAADIWGREPQCGVEKHCGSAKLWLPDGTFLPHSQAPIREVLRTGVALSYVELLIERPDGSRLPVLVNFAALKSAEGEVSGAIASFIDITKHKEAEQTLTFYANQQHALFEFADRANRARTLTEIYDAALDVIVSALPFDRAAILIANENGAMHFAGWRGLSETYRNAVSGHIPWVSDDHDPQPICISNVAEAALTEPLRRAVETEGIAALAFVPIHSRERLVGKFMLYSGVARQFSESEIQLCQTIATTLSWAIERKRGEEDLERLVQERTRKLEETVGELEGFSYSITHDLRAPLRALQGFSHILETEYSERKLDDAAQDYLRRIESSARRMDRLILDVLTYSRILRTDLRLEPINVDTLLRGMLESYPNFQEPDSTVTIEGELPLVLANEATLTQCFSNLLHNAVKFVASGTKPVVKITAEPRGEMVRIWVADNGIGIDPQYFKNVFGMFQRLDPSYEGTGIGLTIVRKSIERIGGAVGVESEPGCGSRFWLDLKSADAKTLKSEPASGSLP